MCRPTIFFFGFSFPLSLCESVLKKKPPKNTIMSGTVQDEKDYLAVQH